MMPDVCRKAPTPGMSIHRLLVDEFFYQNIEAIPAAGLVLDIGGTKKSKRGGFDIAKYDLRVYAVNISDAKGVDVIADGARLPFTSSCADAVICAEMLEHVPNPAAVIAEAGRVLKKGGLLLATAPFLYWIHADPSDYGRYTPQYWHENLARVGFVEINIFCQGGFWCVLADFLWYDIKEQHRAWGNRMSFFRCFEYWAAAFLRRRAVAWDKAEPFAHRRQFASGFGIKARKA